MSRETPPSIRIHINEAITDDQLRDVLLGAEEEGVPVEIVRSSELNPLVLAHEAATSSRLGLGIGIALKYLVVTTDKLPEGRPYLVHLLNTGSHCDRIAGSNAARIVKRIPLRNFCDERNQICKH